MHSCNTVTNWQQHYSPVNVYRPRNIFFFARSTAYRIHFLYVEDFVYTNAPAYVLFIPLKWQEFSWKVFYLFGGCFLLFVPYGTHRTLVTMQKCFTLKSVASHFLHRQPACIMNFPNLLLFIFIFHALVACRAQLSRNLLKLEVPIIHLFQRFAEIEYESFVRLRISATNTPCPMWFAEVSIQHLRVEEVRRVDF